MKVLGIGNAIVDVICKVEESFLSKNNLIKGTMKLVDETEFKKLLCNLKIEETMAGGSVANSIVGNPKPSFNTTLAVFLPTPGKACKSSKLLGTFLLCFLINWFDNK